MPSKQETREERYVKAIIERMKTDSAMAAALKRADNPATEYQCWEYLADFKIDLEKPWERIPYTTVSAAVARAKPAQDGFYSFGAALASCYDEGTARGRDNDQARSKLRRLLACDTIEEVCAILRPLLSLIVSREKKLAYGQLLNQLVWFKNDPQKIRIRWAEEFFSTVEEEP
ncbi:MAG TPA: type I-E CRISPR-associated protein Cse2/CasB [Spirochaetales bacterium]|nr:type I-E CRISPR-associated protein Cse2/CasB [Spirochaetales bacterium]